MNSSSSCAVFVFSGTGAPGAQSGHKLLNLKPYEIALVPKEA
jgi:hypothetical protein